MKRSQLFPRPYETALLILVWIIAMLGFALATAGLSVAGRQDFFPPVLWSFLPPLYLMTGLFSLHLLLARQGLRIEQILLPAVGLLLSLGLVMIYRLVGPDGAWQQLLRGFTPGLLVCLILVRWPTLIERARRLAIPLSLVGLLLPFLTAIFGEVDETGVRLSLKLGPMPSIQTSELIKLALIVFLAWYIEREGQRAEGRARPFLGWLRLPSLWYFVPGALFVALATLALIAMSDYGAVLILGCIFVGMLYAGFDTRTFTAVGLIGLGLALVVGLVLALTWRVPDLIRYRFIAFLDPWSQEAVVIGGQPTDITVSQGPGYQIQQAIYATIAGGIGGSGLGLGTPDYVPLAHSDFIFAAILEEMGAAIGFAILILFAIILLRILRTAAMLPEGQGFERLLLVGIVTHLFIQVFVMVGGTLNLLPMTGVTIPFFSLGGTALLVNLTEIGAVLALLYRLEG